MKGRDVYRDMKNRIKSRYNVVICKIYSILINMHQLYKSMLSVIPPPVI